MKLNTFAVLSFFACVLLAVPPMANASGSPEPFVVTLDDWGNSYYMEILADGKLTPQKDMVGPVQPAGYGNGIGDFDNDGDLDYIMGSNNSAGSIYFFPNSDSGYQFDEPIDVGPWGEGNYSMDFAVADYNNDGNLDFILSLFGTNNCELYTGNGDQDQLEFTPSVILNSAPKHSAGADAAYLDDDENADFVVVSGFKYKEDASLYVNFGNGDGTFDPNPNVVPTYEETTYWGVAAGDFNGDGFADLAATGVIMDGLIIKTGVIDIYRGFGDGTFEWVIRIEDPLVTNRSAVDNYDLNDDQKQDLVIGGYGEFRDSKGVRVLLGDAYEWLTYSDEYPGVGTGSTHWAISTPPVMPDKKALEAKIRFTPRNLNPKSRGKWVQATIWLPEGYKASQVDLDSVSIVENGTPVVYAHSDYSQRKYFERLKKKHKKKHARTIKVKFDRQAVLEMLSGPAGLKTLHVQGELYEQEMLSQRNSGKSERFEGAGKIQMLEPRESAKPKKRKKKSKKH